MFPPKVTLVDTGERRFPREGEYYLFVYQPTGKVSDLCACDQVGDDSDFLQPPESYAIYKVQP